MVHISKRFCWCQVIPLGDNISLLLTLDFQIFNTSYDSVQSLTSHHLLLVTIHITRSKSDSSYFRMVGFVQTYSPKVQTVTAGKSRQQKTEAAGHAASAVRKPRWMEAGAQLSSSSFHNPGPQHME